ncbi:MAG TPA: spore coat protein [Candidatus Yonathbacteria bacterium]|nr:spore coat protein [Candidatus Yonathbacteria bacterium]
MKGIILAGGAGKRLSPLTRVTSKQLLPIYNRPMIYYPLNTLIKAGIKEILIIIAPEKAGEFLNLLGSGKDFGVKFTYEIQDKPRGLPEAFIIGENFLDNDDVVMILGDNIFEKDLSEDIRSFKSGGRVFAVEVEDPERSGVVEFDKNMKVLSIEEKPEHPKSNFIIPGLFIYDSRVIQFAKELEPSRRGELEITDIHKKYLELGELDVKKFSGEWIDAGTFDSLLRANQLAQEKLHKNLVI